MLGMTLAWELAKFGHRVSVFEAAPAAGGLASSWQIGPVTWDRHYHVTLLSDAALRGLLEELDLDRDMQWRPTGTGFYCRGGLHSFSGALDFARLPILNPVDKLRLGAGIYRAARIHSPETVQNLTVEQWLVSLSGQAVFDKFWRPLLKAKLGDDYNSTAASFIWATIQRMFTARRSGLKAELFGYLPGGYARLLETFTAALRRKGVCFHVNAPVRRIAPLPAGPVQIDFANGSSATFDRVVITVPGALAAELCPALLPLELELLRRVQYHGVICASFLLRRPLSPFYITNINDESIPLTGVIEMTNLVDRDCFHGHSLVYLPRYVRPTDPVFASSDESIQGEFFGALRRMHPSLQPEDVAAARVSRARYVFARPTPGSAAHLPKVDTSLSGVHILNSAHISDGTLNVNETVRLAQHHARRFYALAA
jgi:protoporphyrinogen oxidase